MRGAITALYGACRRSSHRQWQNTRMVRFHAQCVGPIAIRILRRGERGKRPGCPNFIGRRCITSIRS